MEVFKNGEPTFTADVSHLHVHDEEEERRTFLDQEQPEFPQIKEEEEEEEFCSSQDLLLKQEIKSECGEIVVVQFDDLSEKHVYQEKIDDEQLHWKQARSFHLDEEEPEFPQIKEEWEERFVSEKGEELELKQETDAFMATEHDQERMDSEPEPKGHSFT
ncbi:hypothetical protein OJAV_G00169460 [Oryzias javanicus]|uniref:Uncharacterized protein n=1 Tax=Oryzias javanicus TaxID=123683 RepID=A0A3S2NX12_ORYJA|nr:hypothetical protein OJAV_G00169460 [Oryzias javanicus]